MINYLFQKEADVTNEWLFYIENEARSLAQRDEFAINNYLDREIFNPEMKKFLQSEFIIQLTEKYQEQEYEPFFFNLYEEYQIHHIEDFYKPRFIFFKKYFKQIFQETISQIDAKEPKEILKKAIYAFIPNFPQGIPTAFLPFIIAYTAFMYKYGVQMTYPALHY